DESGYDRRVADVRRVPVWLGGDSTRLFRSGPQGALIELREKEREPTEQTIGVGARVRPGKPRREMAVAGVVTVQRQADLPQVVLALRAGCCLANPLDARQRQA